MNVSTLTRATARQVADLGAAAGYWTLREDQPRAHEFDRDPAVAIASLDGLRFYITSYQNKIHCKVDNVGTQGGMLVTPSMVMHGGDNYEPAACSQDRPAAKIAAELNRRTVNAADARAVAARVAAEYKSRMDSRATLIAYVIALEGQGWRLHGCRNLEGLDASEHYSTRMYGPRDKGLIIDVRADGGVYLERATFRMQDIAAVAALAR